MHAPEQSEEKNDMFIGTTIKEHKKHLRVKKSQSAQRETAEEKKWTKRLKTRKVQLLNCDLLLSLIRTFHHWSRGR